MDGHNVGMSETGLDPYLTEKPLGLLLRVRPIDFQDFQRFDSPGDRMLRLEDRADSSAAHRPKDGVIANRFSDGEAHRDCSLTSTTEILSGPPAARAASTRLWHFVSSRSS